MPEVKLNTIAADMPPRHRDDGALCMQAALHASCPLNHDYHAGPLTEQEARWLYVERMLEELAVLEPDSGKPEAGDAFEVDDVVRNSSGAIVTIFGTRTTWSNHAVPYVVDTHPYILGEV